MVESLPVPQFPHLSNEGIEQIVSKPFVVLFCLKYIFSFNTASGSKDPTFSNGKSGYVLFIG